MKTPTVSGGGSLKKRMLKVDAMGVAACLAVAAGAYFLGIEPVTHANAEIEEKKRLVDEQTHNAANAEALVGQEKARLEEIKRQLDLVKMQLAPANELNKRLVEIAKLVEGHGLTMQALDPGTPTTDADLGKFVMVPIRLAGTGTFAGVSGFLHELLAKVYPDIEVRSLNMGATPATATPQKASGKNGEGAVSAPPTASFALELRWYAAPAVSAGAETHR